MPPTLHQLIIENLMNKIIPDVRFQDRWLIDEEFVAIIKSCDGSTDASLNDLNRSISKNFSFFGLGHVIGKYNVSFKCLRLSTAEKKLTTVIDCISTTLPNQLTLSTCLKDTRLLTGLISTNPTFSNPVHYLMKHKWNKVLRQQLSIIQQHPITKNHHIWQGKEKIYNSYVYKLC